MSQRKIKFRAWNKETKTMVDLYKLTPLALSSGLGVKGLFIPFMDKLILMQYIGPLDKQGKAIYEGDIIKLTHCNDIYQVEWCAEGYFGFQEIPQIDGANPAQCDIEGWASFEIIGNIYQHSHLLEATNADNNKA